MLRVDSLNRGFLFYGCGPLGYRWSAGRYLGGSPGTSLDDLSFLDGLSLLNRPCLLDGLYPLDGLSFLDGLYLLNGLSSCGLCGFHLQTNGLRGPGRARRRFSRLWFCLRFLCHWYSRPQALQNAPLIMPCMVQSSKAEVGNVEAYRRISGASAFRQRADIWGMALELLLPDLRRL